MLTHEHVQHLARRNDTLSQKISKLKGRAAGITKHGVQLLEVGAGAALGGLLQGLAKDQAAGAHILKMPADLVIGGGLSLAAVLDLAGDEWSSHLGNLGTGFLAAYFTDVGFHIGTRKRLTGSFFPAKGGGALPPGAAVQGEISAQQMADQLMHQMAARQG